VGGLPTNRTVNGFAVDPVNPRTMYVATRDGLFKSIDAGRSWKRLGEEFSHLASVTLSPRMPSEIYVATVEGTVFKSTDGGVKWVWEK
jgi:photosystem II stability/assembly factor-like uncharacterized protein